LSVAIWKEKASLCLGPQFVQEFREIVSAIEDDDQVKVVVFDSAVEGFFLNHSDFLANFEDLKRIPTGPTGLEAALRDT
jgi:enoyl-CoA hydratase/carnithine racemase